MSFSKPTSDDYLSKPSLLLLPDEEDCIDIENKIISFIKGYYSFYGFKKAIIGLSGGIDSIVVAYLTVKAIGEGNVYGVMIPSKFTSAEHLDFALETCKKLNIEYNDFDIVKEYFDDALDMLQNMGERDSNVKNERIKAGNIQSRMRMIVLRDIAKKHNGLVIGTTNKSEMKLGYATIGGDGLGGVDIEPIAGLYKTSLKRLAKYYKVPEEMIIQKPSAELWDGQTDEGELGFSYDVIDQILLGLELKLDSKSIVKSINNIDITVDIVDGVIDLIKRNEFKNKLPATITL